MFEILNFFPKHISEILTENIKENFKELEEIRIRVDKPIILKFADDEVVISYTPLGEEIIKILQIICDNSIYAYQNQICSRIHNSKRWT